MRPLRFVPLLAVLLAVPSSDHAAGPRDALLVSAAWVAQHLDEPNLVLLHVGQRADYDAGHIRGARYAALSAIARSAGDAGGLMLEMLSATELEGALESLGISDSSRVVVYYAGDWVTPATRVLFTLQYAGLGDRASLLDGGLEAWKRAGHALAADPPSTRAGTLSPLKLQPLVVDAGHVRAQLGRPGVSVIDARARALYDGTATGGRPASPHRTGHIAGARSIPFSSVADDRTMIRPSGELQALFTQAGVKPGDTLIVYCHIGQQATAVVLAARTLGYRALLYDGSFEDWSRHADYPVENPSGKEPR
jgi:thiosulfate/3-mercaptopyruvate sulfurtransferase